MHEKDTNKYNTQKYIKSLGIEATIDTHKSTLHLLPVSNDKYMEITQTNTHRKTQWTAMDRKSTEPDADYTKLLG